MSVSPKRIPRIVALAPWLGFSRQCPPFSVCPVTHPHLPACLSASGPVGLLLPAWLGCWGRKKRRCLRSQPISLAYHALQDFWDHRAPVTSRSLGHLVHKSTLKSYCVPGLASTEMKPSSLLEAGPRVQVPKEPQCPSHQCPCHHCQWSFCCLSADKR